MGGPVPLGYQVRDRKLVVDEAEAARVRRVFQLAIDRKLTLIAFEVMNHWTRDGNVGLHVFHKNNELAGYCSVLQAMELIGITGDYGRRLSAVVIGFGATARGAVTALKAHGVATPEKLLVVAHALLDVVAFVGYALVPADLRTALGLS